MICPEEVLTSGAGVCVLGVEVLLVVSELDPRQWHCSQSGGVEPEVASAFKPSQQVDGSDEHGLVANEQGLLPVLCGQMPLDVIEAHRLEDPVQWHVAPPVKVTCIW